ncbi:MAG TPA: AraC family transcriptional regulator [Eubacteriales bacterium]|nr:AraC family transcriptional regulator [Eubacteriales bacterium]
MSEWTLAKTEYGNVPGAPVVYRTQAADGEAAMTLYRVFPGITLFYNEIHMLRCPDFNILPGEMIEINFCQDGRFECEYRNGSFAYLSAGDFSVHKRGLCHTDCVFPLGHYRGVSILVDPCDAARCVNCILEDVSIDLNALFMRLLREEPIFILKAKPCFQHIFSEMYSIPDSIKKGYLKIKVLELLLFLSGMDVTERRTGGGYFSRARVMAAKQAKRYLVENLDRRVPLSELCEQVNASPTALKESFRGVYGSSIYAFARAYKMQEAAVRLCRTDRAVLHIAMDFGYENASKFSTAFRDVIGVSPQEYRKKHCPFGAVSGETERTKGTI